MLAPTFKDAAKGTGIVVHRRMLAGRPLLSLFFIAAAGPPGGLNCDEAKEVLPALPLLGLMTRTGKRPFNSRASPCPYRARPITGR